MMNVHKIASITFIFFIFAGKSSYEEKVKIGLLSDGVDEVKTIFEFAIKKVEQDGSLRKLNGDVKNVAFGDTYDASKKTCNLMKSKAIGIIGPSSSDAASIVRSICDAKEIQLFETTVPDWFSKDVINLHPTPEDLGEAYLDLINAYEWQGFTIIYEDAPWLPMVEYLVINYSKKYPVAVRQLDITANGNYRPILSKVKQSEETNIVLCSSVDKLYNILLQAQQVGLLSGDHNYLITSLDMHTIDLEPFQYSGVNITGLRLINPDNVFVKEVAEEIEKYFEENASQTENESNEEFPESLTADKMQLQTALTYDAVMLFAHIMTINRDIKPMKIDCFDATSVFKPGFSIFNSIKTLAPIKGISGDVQIDPYGNRENFLLDIIELAPEGLKKVGTWAHKSSSDKMEIHHDRYTQSQEEEDIFKSKTLIVVTNVENEPYAMRKQSYDNLIGNAQFEGFGIELIEKLAARIGFNYTFVLQEDGAYGNPIPNDPNNNWNGMIGKLMEGSADLAITDLTMTSERENATDFTMPFMDLGIQILYQKPSKASPELLSFMEPFSHTVWALVACAIFVVSISFFILGRMSPKEWDNPFPCIEEPTELQNQFTFKNAMWFTIGAILQEGSDIAPKAPSTRIVASMWWFFTLIMVSSYTANLASFLTIQKSQTEIENTTHVMMQGKSGKIQYGAKKGGSTFKFFEVSDNEEYQEMYNYMKLNEDKVMTSSNEEGVNRAIEGKYAFFMESSTIEYNAQRKCGVVAVGDKLDQKGYGIAMKKGSPLRGKLDEGILELQESGELARMKRKWWREKRGGGACDGGEKMEAPQLTFNHVKGIFFVLFCGCIIGTTLGIVQWLWNIKKHSIMAEVPFKQQFKDEATFVFQFSKNVKPSYQRKNSSQYDETGSARASNVSSVSRSRSHTNSTINDPPPHVLRLSTKNINKLTREEAC